MHLDQATENRFKMKHRLFIHAIMLGVLLLPYVGRAQWLTQSFELKEGWNAIYLHVDPSHVSLIEAIGSTAETIGESPIKSIWKWQPRLNAAQFIQSPQSPLESPIYWSRWHRDDLVSDDTELTKLHGNTAYLVQVEKGADLPPLKIKGKPVLPSYQWTSSGLNLIGFATPLIDPPTFDQYLVHAPELYRNSEIYVYDGLELTDGTNPARLYNMRGSLKRGQAMWVRGAAGQYNNYFGPIKVTLQNPEGVHFGDSLGQYRVVVQNMTGNQITIKVAPIDSESPPDKQDTFIDPPPLVVRGDLSTDTLDYVFEALPSGGREWVLKPKGEPGSGVEIILGLDRSNMSKIPGDLYAGLLQITDSLDSVGFTRIDLPVTAAVPSTDGLWVGEALVTEVRHDLTDYVEDKTEQTPTLDSAHLDGAQLLTLSGWVRLPGMPEDSKFYGVVGEETTTIDDGGNAIQAGASFAVNHEGKLAFNDGSTLHYASNPSLRPNAWSHVAAVFTGTTTDNSGDTPVVTQGTVQFYLNGSSVGSVTTGVAEELEAAADKTVLGNTGKDQLSPLQGDVYNVRVYDQALNADQVKADYQRQYQSILKPGVTVVGGVAQGSGVTVMVGETLRSFDSGTKIIFSEGGILELTEDAAAGVTTLTGNLTFKNLVDGEKGSTVINPVAGPLEHWNQGFADPSGRRPAGRNATYGKVRRPYKLRMLFHRDNEGRTRLLQRVYTGADKDGLIILTTKEASLNTAQLDSARRLSVAHLPFSKGNVPWLCKGDLAMSGTLQATVEIAHDNHSGNPFLHTYHPDHDNLDARFEKQEEAGRESWTVTRDMQFRFQDEKPADIAGNPMFGALDWGVGLIGGEFSELITLEGEAIDPEGDKNRKETRQFEVRGGFTIRRISEIDTLAMD